MKIDTSKRSFIKNTALVSFGFIGLRNFAHCSPATMTNKSSVYGPLLDDPAGIINLPKGFSYKVISISGKEMSDGLICPGKPDGMATFDGGKDRTIIVRNHEVSLGDFRNGAFGMTMEKFQSTAGTKIYDKGFGKNPGLGGTSTLVYNHKTGEVEEEFMSLMGTIRNCAGGPTPWGSWLTCEEDVTPVNPGNEVAHGYVFEVDAKSKSAVDPVPLKEMGRFNHEAVAVDPNSGCVYLTEDRSDGLIYRFIPNVKGELSKGGKLQALKIKDKKSFDTRNWGFFSRNKLEIGKGLEVEWVDIENPDPAEDTLRFEGFYGLGAAKFARGEGMWYGNDSIYFACTNGGVARAGQVFQYIPSKAEGTKAESANPGVLKLFIEPNDTSIVNSCDNLTVAPWGHVILAEDNESPRLVGVSPKGETYTIAHNIGYPSEFCGVCFSADGSTLFVNIQHVGRTIAITGPWQGA